MPEFADDFIDAESSSAVERLTMADRTKPNARDLLIRARRAEPNALGELLQLYRDYLWLVAESQLHGSATQVVSASDAVQETLMKAHKGFPQFHGTTEQELVGWLRRILANTIVSLARQPLGLRRQDGRRECRLSDLGESSSAIVEDLFVASGTSPSARLSREENAMAFASAMAQLPNHYRTVILLRHVHDLPFAEVACRMNRTQHSVEKIWVRALDRLRQLLMTTLGDE